MCPLLFKVCYQNLPTSASAMSSRLGGFPGLLSTARSYAATSTIHGLSYISSKERPRVERICWSLALLTFLGLAVALSYQSITDYGKNRVLTTISRTELPIGELTFPTVTICSQGLNMDSVTRAVEKDYQKWNRDQAGGDSFQKFLQTKFSMEGDEDYNLLDVLGSLASPDVEATAGQNSARENMVACAGEQQNNRKKRQEGATCATGNFYPHESDCTK